MRRRALGLRGVVSHHRGFSKGVDALPHGFQDELQPSVQGQEMGLSEHRGQRVLQEGLPHHVAEPVLGLRQELQSQERRPLYSGKKKEINSSQQEQLSPVAAGGQRWVKKFKELCNKSSLILILEGNEIFCGNLYFCLCFSRVFVLQISVSREINMTEVVSNE